MYDVAKRIQRARSRLIITSPFYGSLVMQMRMIDDGATETMCTDGESIKYNPAFVESITDGLLLTVLAHEVGHVAYQHHVRGAGKDHATWNRACDHAINNILKRAKFEVPADGNWLCEPRFADLSTEQIYKILLQENGGGSGGGKPGKPGNGPGEVVQSPDPAKAAQKARVQTMAAAQAAKAMGDTSADIERLSRTLANPTLPWDVLLRDFLERQAHNDFTWAKPSRRYMPMGVYMPHLDSKECGELIFMIDVSGSMTQPQLDEIAPECSSIIRDMKPALTRVVYFDTTVKRVVEYDGADDFELRACGGGGTDFVAAFAYVAREGFEPLAVIVFTDLECSRYPKVPEYPVLWVSNGDINTASPPFGERIELKGGEL